MPIAKTTLEAPAARNKADGAHAPNGTSASGPTPVMRELHNFAADIEDLVTATTSLSAQDLARAKAKLASRVASAQLSARNAGIAVDGYTRANPWKAVGIGAAAGSLVGLVLGVMLARRA